MPAFFCLRAKHKANARIFMALPAGQERMRVRGLHAYRGHVQPMGEQADPPRPFAYR
ncbi:hypothetical protein [Xanthomonas euvesicatoria]|uniref:hypothetical protein n=1 Tax=Xanthomonas euvesicatoria TaxID=456327 RepID=UPI001C462F91|nr:hypothetical protein [Xanthomonas euvesicatoria]MBV6867890.1 hypothetical protein [Xanthomonas campestris pv. coriandri]MCE4330810.1 hypothetical protein [Xanthomonas campestris pv. coriandri]